MNLKYLFHKQSSTVKREPLNVKRKPSTIIPNNSETLNVNHQPSTIIPNNEQRTTIMPSTKLTYLPVFNTVQL